MTLREAIHQHVFAVLVSNNMNRQKTANELEISVRGVRDHIKRMNQSGYEIESLINRKIEEPEKIIEKRIFATNKERLRHADFMINRVYL